LANATRSAGNTYGTPSASADFDATQGRWPANLIHDGSDEVVGLFPANRPGAASNGSKSTGGLAGSSTFAIHPREQKPGRGDSGSAARFFYCAKASKADRDEGLGGFEVKRTGGMSATADGSMLTGSGNERTTARANVHPTVKPTDLMRYLCRLVTPPGGTVLDPFAGSGSTGKAAALEGFCFIGIEREAEYVEIARARIAAAVARAGLFERTAS
jgi:site-specific DNA-methyltransferase (adenine-specific)